MHLELGKLIEVGQMPLVAIGGDKVLRDAIIHFPKGNCRQEWESIDENQGYFKVFSRIAGKLATTLKVRISVAEALFPSSTVATSINTGLVQIVGVTAEVVVGGGGTRGREGRDEILNRLRRLPWLPTQTWCRTAI
ncbi:unnamed protein product [Linum tenue]|uniref:Uncharacterized protein n=1 Tax=Linum tenue TaxID=586396 RepID=A0AAV0MS82_9ROSI|nr:unnamed protein product [Linum tenue]